MCVKKELNLMKIGHKQVKKAFYIQKKRKIWISIRKPKKFWIYNLKKQIYVQNETWHA